MKKQNLNSQELANIQKQSIKAVKSTFFNKMDEELRGFNANKKLLDEALKHKDSLLLQMLNEDKLTAECFDFERVKKYTPAKFNSAGVYCSTKEVTPEEWEKIKATLTKNNLPVPEFKEFAGKVVETVTVGKESKVVSETEVKKIIIFYPKSKWTPREFYTMFKTAEVQRRKKCK